MKPILTLVLVGLFAVGLLMGVDSIVQVQEDVENVSIDSGRETIFDPSERRMLVMLKEPDVVGPVPGCHLGECDCLLK